MFTLLQILSTGWYAKHLSTTVTMCPRWTTGEGKKRLFRLVVPVHNWLAPLTWGLQWSHGQANCSPCASQEVNGEGGTGVPATLWRTCLQHHTASPLPIPPLRPSFFPSSLSLPPFSSFLLLLLPPLLYFYHLAQSLSLEAESHCVTLTGLVTRECWNTSITVES